MVHAERGTLEYAQQKEKTWKRAEILVGVAAVVALAIWEDAEVHEIPLAITEGVINWRRAHWSHVVEQLSAGEAHPEADYSQLGHHVLSARRRHIDIKSQLKTS